MAIGKAVQFRGISDAVNAYENYKAPGWALFQGTQLLHKYDDGDLEEGKNLLQEVLDAYDIHSANSTTYTLAVYKDLPKGTRIKNNTPFDGSFNFRLQNDLADYQQTKVSGVLEQRIAGLESKLDAALNPPEADEEPTGKEKIFDALGKLFEHPQVQQLLASKIVEVVNGASNMITGLFKPAAPSGAYRPAGIGSTSAENSGDQNQQLQTAINILAGVDPDLGTHLLTLARVAEKDPAKYKNLIGMLNLL